MTRKCALSILVALSLNSAFAAITVEELIEKDNYQRIYLAFRCGGVEQINAALAKNQKFNHKNDKEDIIRSSQTGLALRKAVIGLNAADLQAVVENNHEFFKTSLGVSLVYGWTLNQFEESITPYYIGYYFSFDKLFLGMASKMADHYVANFLKRTFTLGLRAVEDDRWAFYDNMLYLPYAIQQVRLVENAESRPSTLSIDDVIRMSRRTKDEVKAEKQAAAQLDEIQDAYVIVEEDFLESSFASKTTNLHQTQAEVLDKGQSMTASFDETASDLTLLDTDEEYDFAEMSPSPALEMENTPPSEKYFDENQGFITKKFISVYAVIINLVS